MSTLLEMYKENKLISKLSQKVYFANIQLFIKELNELSNEFKKDVCKLIRSNSSEKNAYLINNIFHTVDYINMSYDYLWNVKYRSNNRYNLKLERVKNKFILSSKVQTQLFMKLKESSNFVKNLEQQEMFRSYAEAEIEGLNTKSSKYLMRLQDELVKISRKYSKEIYTHRNGSGVAVLKNRVTSDWVSPESLIVYLENAKNLGKSGPTILIDQNEFITNLQRLNKKDDRESFLKQAFKSKKIYSLWNQLVIKKLRFAEKSGYDNYLDFTVSNNILNSKGKVIKFLKDNLKSFKPGYTETLQKLTSLAKKDGNNELNVSDIYYYYQKLNKSKFHDEESFRIENVLEVLNKFLNNHLNISLKFKKLKKNGIHFNIDLNDLKNNRKGSVLLTNIDNSNLTLRSGDYFNQNMTSNNFSIVNVIINKDGFMTYNEVGVLFHEFGHVLQNFVCKDKKSNLNYEVWETVEVPSLFIETLSKSYYVLKDLDFYKTKSSKPKKLSRYIFNKLKNISKESDFENYIQNYKFLIMVEMYSKNYDQLKSINPSEYLTKKLIKAKVPYLWTDDDNNFISHSSNDYGAMPYIYLFSQTIVNRLIEKIRKKAMIDSNIASVDYIFRNVLNGENGKSSISKLNKIYKDCFIIN